MALNFANNNSLSSITALPASISGGSLNLISTQTASSSSSLSFTSGIDSTYKEYVFKFINIHPATNNADWTFNMSIDGGSNYNATKTTTAFQAAHAEDDGVANLEYKPTMDLAQSTAYQIIGNEVNNANDSSTVGSLHLFDPSSTVFVKHFTYTGNVCFTGRTVNVFHAGYANTTSAVNAVDFKFSSGNIDSGVIKLYGVS
jgi:hypothetical protein|tara:strand:+ start:235 stop:837 length:603 start_codon:yes stop_codon:yes gene_type:complete